MRLSSLGDIVNMAVIFSKLRQRFPDAEIELLVKKQFKDIVDPNDYNIKITPFDSSTGLSGWLNLCREKKEQNFDLFLDMHANLRSKILGFYLPKVKKLNYKKPYFKRFFLFNFHINFFSKHYNLVNEYLRVLKPLGIDDQNIKTEISLTAEARSGAEELLERKGVSGKYAVITPISAWGPKRYPLEKFIHISDYLVQQKGLPVVWLGGKGDTYLDNLSVDAEKNTVVVGETTLKESIALLEKAEINISNDTGLPYAAQAVGTPALIIFGPSSRETSAGYVQNGSRTCEIDIWCRPCSKGNRKCFRKKQYCMLHDEKKIFNLIDKILKGVKE
jgi:ADP-heptose:LPS heptosyltransferase